MKHTAYTPYLRGTIWFLGAGLSLMSLVGAPLIHSLIPMDNHHVRTMKRLDNDLVSFGLRDKIDHDALIDLVEYCHVTGKSLPSVMREPAWLQKFGLASDSFKATWYIANPYELLPADLKIAIKNKKTPFKTQAQVWEWVRSQRGPDHWKKALRLALIETTPINLWRASRGKKPYTKNGEFLKPIVIEKDKDILEIRNGHIATDPRVIPTNTELLILVRIEGRDRLLKVKAADIGGGIKGKHVDLPIHLNPKSRQMPKVRMPSEKIGNRSIQIIMPISKMKTVNRGRKA